jgi:homoserine kinase
LGPGYDTIGMALDIWSEMTVERASEFSMSNEGEGAAQLPRDETNLVCIGVAAAFKAAGKELPPLKYTCKNRIPFARGLGSSSAAIVGGIVAGLVLAGKELTVWGAEELLQIAAGIEGHPDNVAPAIYGGIQLGIHNGERWVSDRVRCPDHMQCCLFIPDHTAQTSEARALLSDTISREDAVFNIGRMGFLINAFSQNNLANLKHATEDRLHQPQRGAVQSKHLFPMMEAAIGVGAFGCFLSGAGPTVLAITGGNSGDIFTQRGGERKDHHVALAMEEAAKKCGVTGRLFVTQPSGRGAFVARAIPDFNTDRIQRFQEIAQI